MTPRPYSLWKPSPNCHAGRIKPISCIILHATATGGVASPLEWLCDPASIVSAHYLIDTDGTIYHLVHEIDAAWHAGVSSWGGESNVNDFSVGIELVNAYDGKMPYSESQLDACVALVRPMMADYNIAPSNVVGHLDIAPGRKTDPAAFPWDSFRKVIIP